MSGISEMRDFRIVSNRDLRNLRNEGVLKGCLEQREIQDPRNRESIKSGSSKMRDFENVSKL